MKHTVEIDLLDVNKLLQGLTAMERIGWAVETFGHDAVLLSSMQSSASVLMHSFYRMELDNEVIFVDTGYHFQETLQLRDEFMRRYKLNMVTLYPELTPEQQEKKFEGKLYLSVDGQKECCRLRKTVPFINHMMQYGRKLAMVGLRRSEGGRRAKLSPLIQDPRTKGYTLHPLFDWTDEQIQAYLQKYDVPVHPLHRQNYPSIGCECCTTPVGPGEDPRAGRWRHLAALDDGEPKYCKINFSDGLGI
ncbi:MAG: phosphoadenylyl-sulfate reductase [Candidatus Brocadia sp.]|nr:phosphoadenylyl-sulfate reductase [Candidatus Brocadia sp.]